MKLLGITSLGASGSGSCCTSGCSRGTGSAVSVILVVVVVFGAEVVVVGRDDDVSGAENWLTSVSGDCVGRTAAAAKYIPTVAAATLPQCRRMGLPNLAWRSCRKNQTPGVASATASNNAPTNSRNPLVKTAPETF